MAEHKLEITKKLEDMAVELEENVAILNLPSANYCEKRAEMVNAGGKRQQSCLGCVTQDIRIDACLKIGKVKRIIDYFHSCFGTRFITINGRGDPFHPKLKEDNLEKIRYSSSLGMQAYVFSAGDNLGLETCAELARNRTNVMISLFGNAFLDGDFFCGKEYSTSTWPMQNQARIAVNLRRLNEDYQTHPEQPEIGSTRIGMNYVVSERDLADDCRIRSLKQEANANRIAFVCNTNFLRHPDDAIQRSLERIALEHSDFHLRHTTVVDGRCQMGAGSSVTIDYDGMILRCPYMDNKDGDGRIQELSDAKVREIIFGYLKDRRYPCVMRKP